MHRRRPNAGYRASIELATTGAESRAIARRGSRDG
jgi:hypothetical protein